MTPQQLISQARNLYLNGHIAKAQEINNFLATQNLPEKERLSAKLFNLTLLSSSNKKDEIRKICLEVLENHPHEYSFLFTLTTESEITSSDLPLLEKYENFASKIKGLDNPHDELFYGLATGYETLGDYKKAAKYYIRANAINKSNNKFDFIIEDRILQKTPEIFTKEFFNNLTPPESNNKKMIFVIGMPRSSTSLVEQILASHSKIAGAGEQMLVENLIMATTKLAQNYYPDCLENVTNQQISQLRNFYLQEISQKFPDSEYIVDKMPLNFLHLGLISAMFPDAKIINCVRDLRDVAISIYSKKFLMGNFWAQDFADIHHIANIYVQMMDYWKNTLPIDIYDANYQNLIEDFENETKNLINHCGLDWENSCLEFYKNKRTVLTASKSQVKKPIFKSSLARWQNYEPYFGKELKKINELQPS